jgi:phytoene dehydrogenase-like protein
VRVLVVGGGHNGLVAACYLASAGAEVLVLEQADRLGGGSRTTSSCPDTGSTRTRRRTTFNATGIVDELGLREYGLTYREMDPFAVAVSRDGTIVRFHRDLTRPNAT